MAQHFCAKCGTPLAQYQIDAATADAGYAFDEAAAATMAFACSGFTEEDGCLDNDADEMACWWADTLPEDET